VQNIKIYSVRATHILNEGVLINDERTLALFVDNRAQAVSTSVRTAHSALAGAALERKLILYTLVYIYGCRAQ
jgi:hypothetical protein